MHLVHSGYDVSLDTCVIRLGQNSTCALHFVAVASGKNRKMERLLYMPRAESHHFVCGRSGARHKA